MCGSVLIKLMLAGSGSLAAMGVFEARFRPDMEVCLILTDVGFNIYMVMSLYLQSNSWKRQSYWSTTPLALVFSMIW